MVAESYRRIGQRLSQTEQPALLLDAMLPSGPIVGISKGFESMLGRSVGSLVGRRWTVLLEGLEKEKVSNSTCQDIEDFLRMSRLRCITSMADCMVSIPCVRSDGQQVTLRSCLRLLKADEWVSDLVGSGDHHPLVLAMFSQDAPHDVCDWSQDFKLQAAEAMLPDLKAICPSPCLFPMPLSNKCILLNGRAAAMRREPHQVPRGCVIFGSSEIHPAADSSHFFSIRVDKTLTIWNNRMPFVGFTCTSPEEVAKNRYFFGTVPHAFYLGESVVIGGTGEAWMRSDAELLAPKLGQPPEKHAQRRHLSPQLPEHKRSAPWTLRPGDLLGCRYRRCGLSAAGAEKGTPAPKSVISLFINGDLAFEFSLDGQLPACKPLYAVVDVCHAVYQVTMMPGSDAFCIAA